MIQYTLRCDQGHDFDSWFASAQAYDKLAAAGMVACAVCGSTGVSKAMMTPRLRTGRDAAATRAGAGALAGTATPAEQALAELRRRVEENADYVGRDFVAEARAMHAGDAPERSIYGEARIDEARALIEDGVPVAPLPFRPQRKVN